MGSRLLVLIGTRKGAFILEGDEDRRAWQLRGPFCDLWPIHDVSYDASTGTIFAGGGSPWYGASVWRSDDLGESWTQSSEGLRYGDADEDKLRSVWSVTPGRAETEGTVYAGVEPAGLFRSDDSGRTWGHVAGLRDHPSRPTWEPGAGGLILHSIVPHPEDAARMWVGISAVGTFATDDGGATWEARNRGVRADFNPEPNPVTGQCVHKLVMPPSRSDMLYQQNHCGVYRSADDGVTWQEITAGLPSQFGFPMVTHPRDAATVYVIPLNGDDRGRVMPDGSAAVWRSRDAGDTWQRLGDGLPQEGAYLGVLREAMAVDTLEPAGIYFGTSTGHLFASFDEGDSWSLISDFLPAIWSVDTVVLDG
jgi:photosystem II stability/assembly factor-like uncharacterized protein